MKISELNAKYDKLQLQYGAKELTSIYNGGCTNSPDFCFVFMNPTEKILHQIQIGKGEDLLGLELRIYGNCFIE